MKRVGQLPLSSRTLTGWAVSFWQTRFSAIATLRVVGSATTRAEVISAIRKLQPDIAVISSRLQDGTFAGLLVVAGTAHLANAAAGDHAAG